MQVDFILMIWIFQEIRTTMNIWESFHQQTNHWIIPHQHPLTIIIQFIRKLKRMVDLFKLTIIDLNYNFPISEYSLEDYYSSNRINSATSTVNYNNNVIAHKSNLNLVVSSNNPEVVPVVRVVKRRTTANKKERRRTMSINGAYTSLRDHIPNVPSDTKLSKVSLIFYLSITLLNNYFIFK